MAGLLRTLGTFATVAVVLGWGLCYSQSVVVVMGCALYVRRSKVLFDVDLWLLLCDRLGGGNPAVKSFLHDLGGL